MKLYIDEDMASRHLLRALRQAGYDVVGPLEASLLGESDVIQLTFAIRNQRVLMTANHGDFQDLHDLILVSGGSHAGIFTLRKDGDRRRDIKPQHITQAIGNVMSVLASARDRLVCLNEWR